MTFINLSITIFQTQLSLDQQLWQLLTNNWLKLTSLQTFNVMANFCKHDTAKVIEISNDKIVRSHIKIALKLKSPLLSGMR